MSEINKFSLVRLIMFVHATQIYALQSSLLQLGPTYWKKISEFMNMNSI